MARKFSRRAMLGAAGIAAVGGLATLGPRRASAAETVRILYTNDTHARLEPFRVGAQSLGGIARRKTIIDSIRALGGNIILLDAGDVFQGTLYFNVWEGIADLQFINALGYDAVAIGNHEFDKGPEPLARFLRGARFPMVSANIVVQPGTPLSGLIRPAITRQVGAMNIGIVGLTTDSTPILASPGATVRFNDHYSTLQGTVDDQLSRAGVSAFIGLTHIGLDDDRLLASRLRGVGVIVGGHSHTRVDPSPEVVTDANGLPVLIVQAQDWGRYVGVLDVQFDEHGRVTAYRGGLIPVSDVVAEDPSFVSALRPWKSGIDELQNRPAGSATALLDQGPVRSGESNLGNLICDVCLSRTNNDRAQVALMNGGGIRASIPAGTVTYGQIIEVLPFGNVIVNLDLSGSQLVAALESGLNVEAGSGRFPQVGGLRYQFDPTRPVGSRLISVELRNRDGSSSPIVPGETYRVTTNDFLAGGGDGYSMLTQGRNQVNTGLVLADVLIEHFERNSPVSVGYDGRIQRFGAPVLRRPQVDWDPDAMTSVADLWLPGEGLQPLLRPVFAFV